MLKLKSFMSKPSKSKTPDEISELFTVPAADATKAKLLYEASIEPQTEAKEIESCKTNARIYIGKSSYRAKSIFESEIANFPNINSEKAKNKIIFYADHKNELASNNIKIKDYPEYNLGASDIDDIQSVLNISSAYKNTLHVGLSEKQVSNRMAALVATTQIVGYVDDPKFQALAGGFYDVCASLNKARSVEKVAIASKQPLTTEAYNKLMNQR